MFFVIIAIIVLQVIISFIVEAFVFKIQARERSRACSKHHVLRGECGCDDGKKYNSNFKGYCKGVLVKPGDHKYHVQDKPNGNGVVICTCS